MSEHPMKASLQLQRPPARRRGFTIIELLVVIAIIGILAALVVSGVAIASRKAKLSRIKTELNEVVTAIENYKAKLGFYPPDGVNPALPPLYYELVGVYQDPLSPTTFRSGDNRDTILGTAINSAFGVPAFANTAAAANEVRNFFTDLSVAKTDTTSAGVEVLRPSVGAWTNGGAPRWSYNSRNPVHNPKTYDLWVDVVINGETNRVANWKTGR
jgi:prepilin-type N-terminal cleavage/methylation domain-containing protein